MSIIMDMCVVIISIPKSGTYLLNEVVTQLNQDDPHFRSVFIENCFAANYLEAEESLVTQKIMESPSNICCMAHWEYDEKIRSFLNSDERFKPIFIYRNPLDIVVSFVEGARLRKFSDPMADALLKIPSVQDKFIMFVDGRGIQHPNAFGLRSIIDRRKGWRNCPEILSVRYESLISKDKNTIDNLSAYLNFSVVEVKSALRRALRNKNSITLRSGETGDWRTFMTKRTQDICISILKPIIEELGYEL